MTKTMHAALLAAGLLSVGCGTAEQPKATTTTTTTTTKGTTDTHTGEIAAAPLPAAAIGGLAWLAAAQGEDGGYGQDGKRPRDGVHQESLSTDVANTAIAALAFLRGGTSPTAGEHRAHLLAAVDYVIRSIEAAPEEGLAVTDKTGTQIQRKLGPFVDTFLSAMLLTELKGRMPDADRERRLVAAIDKCVDKIEKNQQQDGSWNAGGWAPVIATSLASRSLFAAQNKGVAVDERVLARVEAYTKNQFDDRSRDFKVGEADAGVSLYKVAQAFEQASREPSATENLPMLQAAGGKLASARFQDGFGSMGGEEFISYMNISDSLARTGGEQWQEWNGNIQERLTKLQNEDGSWAGHHCITGRVACTSAALLTLLAERHAGPRVAAADGK
jgi:hypothetical protein